MDEKYGLPFLSVSVIMYRKVIHDDFFVFSFHICRNTVCWDPDILLRDVTYRLLLSMPTSMLRPRCASSTKQKNNNNNGLTISMKPLWLQFTMVLQLSSFPSQHFNSHKSSLVNQLVCFHYLQSIMGGMTKYENYLATFKKVKKLIQRRKKIRLTVSLLLY